MSSRLLDRIQSGKFKCRIPPLREGVNGLINLAIAVDVENVARWAKAEDKMWSDLIHMMPHKLPFPIMWFEWTSFCHEGEEGLSDQNGILLLESVPAPDSVKNDKSAENLEETIIGIHFMHIAEFALTCCLGFGEFSNNYTNYRTRKDFDFFDASFPMNNAAGAYMNVIVPSLVFFGCKNVTVRKLEASRKRQKKFDRLFRDKNITMPSFHIIEIHNQRVRNVYEGGISHEPSAIRARLIRGTYHTYKEDAPLFGKHVGTWFWQPHVRGTIGTPVVSDYRVHEPKHKGECKVE